MYVEIRNGEAMLYTRIIKALYGCLKYGLLFWRNITEFLTQLVWSIHLYDTCISNKIINSHQCTIIWHTDDLKISHIDSKVVDRAGRYKKGGEA